MPLIYGYNCMLGIRRDLLARIPERRSNVIHAALGYPSDFWAG